MKRQYKYVKIDRVRVLKYVMIYWLIINIITVIICIVDMKKAKENGFGIDGRILVALTLLGGSIGIEIMMNCINKHNNHYRFMKFAIWMPILIVWQFILLNGLSVLLEDLIGLC